jgi:hypothetical protein
MRCDRIFVASLLSPALRNAVEKENDKEEKNKMAARDFHLTRSATFSFLLPEEKEIDRQTAIDSAGFCSNQTTRSLP